MITAEEKRALRNNLAKYEGTFAHMYLDTLGNVTVGMGHLISSAAEAQKLSFYTRDGKRATSEQIKTDYENVKKRPYGAAYRASTYAEHVELRLNQTAIDSLTDTHISSFESELKRLYPKFDAYPTEVRLALFDMIFNVGGTKLRNRFPKFNDAIIAEDWAEAAEQSHRVGIQATRNRYIRDLLEKLNEAKKQSALENQ